MDTKDLLQMNNFAGGMNTDTSDMVLREDQYRLANNLRYITNTQENSGELHLIEGASKAYSIPGNIIASTNLRDTAIFVVEAEGKWQVWKIIDNNPKLVADIDAEDDRVIGHKLSLVTRYENDTNQKLYIADGVGPIICVQLYTNGNIPTKLHDVESVPFVKFSKPIFCGLIDGNIKASVVEYSYQFYKKYGQQSEISPSTKLIPLFKGSTTAKQSNKILGYLPDQQTDKGVKIKIRIDEDLIRPFDRIKIFRISYIETGQLPQIECVYDDKITQENGFFIFEDRGRQSLAVYTLEEYNSITGIHIIPKTIESKDDYMFAANVKDDNTGFDVKNWDPENIQLKLVTVDLIGDHSVSPDSPVSKPKTLVVTEGTAHYVTDPPVLQSTIQTSDEVFDLSDYIDTTNDILGYWNPQVSYMFKSLRRGEKYRFGIIFYDTKGRSSGVIHIKDVPIDIDTDMFDVVDGRLVVRPVGIKFTINQLPEGTASYEIVRCGRSVFDTQTITQGVLSRPIAREYTDSNDAEIHPLTPTGLVTIHNVSYSDWDSYTLFASGSAQDKHFMLSTNTRKKYGDVSYEGNSNIFQFISPEISYLSDTTKDIMSDVQLYIQPVKYICPYAFSEDEPKNVRKISSPHGEWDDPDVINYGNKYANIISRPGDEDLYDMYISGRWDTMVSDYLDRSFTTMDFRGGDDEEETWFNLDKIFSYSKLYYSKDILPDSAEYEIQSTGFPETLNWDDFATPQSEKFQLIYPDKVTAIGGKNFTNWVCGSMFGRTDETKIKLPSNDSLKDGACKKITSMGPGGKCALLSINSGQISASVPNKDLICSYICNIKKRSVLDESNTAKKNAVYRSFGDYYSADEKSGFIFNGDCFIQVFEYIAQHKFAHPSSKYYRMACKIFAFPLETSVNLAYTSGYEFNKEYNAASGDISYIQNSAGNVNNLFVQDKPLYSYNSVYSSIDTSKQYVSELQNDPDEKDLQTDCRVFHSNVKSNNETVDNWLKYQPANFIDVDTRKGPITGLRTFKNQLVFWQEYATGLLSVNERSVITDESNLPLILGNGGVLQRFDYVTNTNGMHIDDYSDAQSNTTLYWWDRTNKSICGYSGGQDAIELSKIKFVQNYLNKNTPVDNPVLAYDNKTKEVVSYVVDGKDKEFGSVIYNEHIGQFTSIYNINPRTKVELSEGLLFTLAGDVYKWNTLVGKRAYGFNEKKLFPYIKHIVNHNGSYTKVFDNAEFAGRVYGGELEDLECLTMKFSTPLKQYGELDGSQIQNREYNFKYVIPRNEEDGEQPEYGDRLRGKTMQCELESSSNSYDFSLQFIKTKFRISWS